MTQATPTRPRSRIAGLSVWLLLIGLALLFLPLLLLSRAVRSAEAEAQLQLDGLRTSLASTPTLPAQLDSLAETRLERMGQVRALDGIRRQLIAQHINFPELTSTLLNFRPENLMLTQVLQVDAPLDSESRNGWLLVSGEAHYEAQVIEYIEFLRGSETFTRVDVQSITLESSVPGTPTTNRNIQATIDASQTQLPIFERGAQWVVFTLRLTWASNNTDDTLTAPADGGS